MVYNIVYILPGYNPSATKWEILLTNGPICGGPR